MDSGDPPADSRERFDRQTRFAPLGHRGQQRLGGAHVAVVGCGALGGVIALHLHRAGVGRLTLVDRDVVEVSNLPRQVLFDEEHARHGVAKAEAAAETLARGGGPTRITPCVEHVDAGNAERLLAGADLLLDGTDNLPTRYLLNDVALARDVPYVYGGVVGSAGVCMSVLPRVGPCLRCLFPEPPPAGSLPTCDSAGVLGPAVGAVGAFAAGQALRLLADPGARDGSGAAWFELDVWNGEASRRRLHRAPACPACGPSGELAFLRGGSPHEAVRLCGRAAVQLPPPERPPDLERLAERWLAGGHEVRRTASFLRWRREELRLTLFPDGRALVEGTEDPGRARALYDRLVGS